MASTDARPVPLKNTAFRAVFPIYDADGDLVTGAASLDSEVSLDQGTFSDCTNEATEIATSSGLYYLDLTSSEMNADCVAVIVKTGTAGAKTTVLVFYPEETGDINVDVTAFNGTAATASGGRPEVNTSHIAGSAVSTSSAQIGVNVVNAAGTAWNSGAISASTLAADTITAGKIAADAIGASELAADAVAEIADAVWDEATTGHTTSGTFGEQVKTDIDEILTDTGTTLDGRIPAALVGGRMDANVGAISGDATAADNAEAFFDGTGYAGTGNVIPTVTTVNGFAAGAITAAAIATGAIDADALAADAVAEIADAVWDEATTGHTTSGTFGEQVKTDIDEILTDTGTTLDGRIPAALVGGRMDANVGAISGDATAADNAEAFFDGTGYAGTGNVIPTVTTVNGFAAGAITAAAIATGAIDADALAADAVDEIWDEVMEGSTTARQSLRLANAANGAKLSGAATTTVTIRDIADSKDRISATVDSSGNRTAVTLDLT